MMSMVWRWNQRYAALSGGHGVRDDDVIVIDVGYVVSGVIGSSDGISNVAGRGGEVYAVAGVSTSEAVYLVVCDPSMNEL